MFLRSIHRKKDGKEGAGINRSEVGDERALRERSNDPLGPEFGVAAAARPPTKHKTGDRRAGYRASKSRNQGADAIP
jgi:hypothetical protein